MSELCFEFDAPQYLESLENASTHNSPQQYFGNVNKSDGTPLELYKTPRRLWSNTPESRREVIDHLAMNVSAKKNLNKTFDGIDLLPTTPAKKHSMTTRLDTKLLTPTLNLRNRSILKKLNEESDCPQLEEPSQSRKIVKVEKYPMTQLEPPSPVHDITPPPPPALAHKRARPDEHDSAEMPRKRTKIQEEPEEVINQKKTSKEKKKRLLNRKHSTWNKEQPVQSNSYLSIAEQTYHFQYDTPPRFHTKQPGACPPKLEFKPLLPTVPVTPNLTTSHRQRHRNIEKEDDKTLVKKETFPIRKTRAACLKTPVLREFNWTNNKLKKEEPFHFKAHKENSNKGSSQIYPEPNLSTVSGVPCVIPGKSTKLDLLNGTIYDRGQAMMLRKQEKINKMIEEGHSKDVRQFRARPAPSFVTSRSTNPSQDKHSKCLHSINSVEPRTGQSKK